MKVDRASMLNSLEVRAPFLDIDVVDFLRRLRIRVDRGGVTKIFYLPRARTFLPEEVVNRSKQGFAVPSGHGFEMIVCRMSSMSSIRTFSTKS